MRNALISEFGLIEKIKKSLKNDLSVIRGPGDDCAVLRYDKRRYLLFTCDMLVEGVDFTKKDDPFLVGRKALAVSVSDIAACGGMPRYCLVSLGLKKSTKLKDAEKIVEGIRKTAGKYYINIVGGDISRAKQTTIDVSMIGIVEKKNLILRKSARPGDIIFVSGPLGGSIHGKHLKFNPRLKESRYLTKNYRVNSMIDISDGLAQDLWHVLEESKVGAVIYEDLIPLSKEARNLKDGLSSGEDFELIFTLSLPQAKKLLEKKPHKFFAIGKIYRSKPQLWMIDRKNRMAPLSKKGFKHF